jgi:hypothetical protein
MKRIAFRHLIFIDLSLRQTTITKYTNLD